MLEIKHLSAGYPGKPVLEDISLTAAAGEVTAILGPNGCGKSTLLKALCGILPATGAVTLDGEDLRSLNPKALARRVCYLAQSRRIPDITAGRLVLHGRFPYLGYPRRYRAADYAAADAAMARMGVAELADTPLAQLSGGQRQKVYIAMALAQDTPVILLDEPTTYLDVGHQLSLLAQARELAAAGRTVVMVLHDLSHALTTADHVALMAQGRIAAAGTPEAVYRSGKLEEVFGVSVRRAEIDGTWRYFCQQRDQL